MPSVLNVDTLVAANGTDPVTLTKQSAAKGFGNVDLGTTVLKSGSLNASSVSDDGVGICTISFVSAMADANYSHPAIVYNDRVGLVASASGTTYTTTAKKFEVSQSNDASRNDYDFTYTIQGDLA
jgi:hypothetical protein